MINLPLIRHQGQTGAVANPYSETCQVVDLKRHSKPHKPRQQS
jgi:hypothetical protein